MLFDNTICKLSLRDLGFVCKINNLVTDGNKQTLCARLKKHQMNKTLILKESAKNGHLDIVKFIVEKGANIHTDDDYPLTTSAENKH